MEDKKKQFGFRAENYKLLLIGLLVNVVGYLLMIGGAATSLNEFNENELFSTVRITLAPVLIVAGFVIVFYAIMRKGKKSND